MFSEDLSAYFRTQDFGVAATYDGATTVNVIFDNEYLEQMGVAGTGPAALGRASDFPENTAIGKTLLINGTTYTIRGREPLDDGQIVVLRLAD